MSWSHSSGPLVVPPMRAQYLEWSGPMRELHSPTDLDTVGLRVEGPAVVELQDDERERVRLPHLLVVIQRWTLVWDVSLEDQQNKGLCLTVCISISQLKVLFVLIFLIAGLALVSSLTIRWIIDQIWSTMSASLLSSPHIHSGLLDIQELRNFPLFLAQRAEVFEGVRHKPLVSRD